MASTSEERKAGDPQLTDASDLPLGTTEPEPLSRVASGPAWSTFTHRQKLGLVMLGSAAAFLSPVTANIYYPAMTTLEKELHVSYNLLNLTITVYLIFQGLAPTFIGALSDASGRRPAYLLCFVIYLAANIGLALQSSYPALMVLRCLQSAGSSGTIALGNAMVSDVVTSSERGLYIGYASIGTLLGPTLGPIIGGLLNQYLGWRSIFWFLAIFSLVVLLVFLLFLPETCRSVVGDGSIPPQIWNRPFLQYAKVLLLNHRNAGRLDGNSPSTANLAPLKRRKVNLLGTIEIIFTKESICILLYSGLLFAGFYTIVAAIPRDFALRFGFDSLQIGLCYLPFGFGGMISSILTGRAMDYNFVRHAKLLGIPVSADRQTNTRNFPVEKARLQIVGPLIGCATILIMIYGWVLEETTSLAGPLVVLFPLGGCISGSFSAMITLMVDLYPLSPGTSTAAANLVRCGLGAGAVAAIGPILDAVGTGWVSVMVAGVWVVFSPLLWLVWTHGARWREEKRVRDEEKRNLKDEERGTSGETEKEGGEGEGGGHSGKGDLEVRGRGGGVADANRTSRENVDSDKIAPETRIQPREKEVC